MKKEGTGKPENPDIAFAASVKMRELYFEEVPDPEVRFRGNTERNSVWGSKRENLPDEVEEGVLYRNSGVRLRIASEVANSDPDLLNSSSKKREKTSSERQRQSTGQQETETKEENK
jgi:hypothetical protein